ncbi:hypothetical protein DK254_10560 [Pseudomonas sp. RW407]|nr:hypothetical protein DK254_10560 [Pseudomonas sp. RW407]
MQMTHFTRGEIEDLLQHNHPAFRFSCCRQLDGCYAISLRHPSQGRAPATVVGISGEELCTAEQVESLGQELIRTYDAA